MLTLVSGSLLLSLLHAIIPNHWLPILAIGRKENWSLREVLQVTAFSGLSHVASTLIIGWGLAFFGWELSQKYKSITPFIAPTVLIVIGSVFIYRHHRHKHFHVADQQHQNSKFKMIASLSLAMFFSPCLEVEGYFLAAGVESFWCNINRIGIIILFPKMIFEITGSVFLQSHHAKPEISFLLPQHKHSQGT
jgi:putative Mn2+ efflux pump MntP